MKHEFFEEQPEKESPRKPGVEKFQDVKKTQEMLEAHIKAIAKEVDPEFEVEVKPLKPSGFKGFKNTGTSEETIIVVRKPSDKRFLKVVPYDADPEKLRKSLQGLLA